MRTLIAAIGLSLVGTSVALAALPPQYQRQAELLAIIGDEGVVEAFGFGGIEGVELNGVDHYIVRGGDCMLDVMIEDLPNQHEAGWAGPREFKLVLGTLVCEGAQ
ncbi:hypothetical protein SAMN05428969_0149 [Devosia sp. YR412]|uniref:hypothetical protein n=1 Tax=Devosia sp. YR412 TaxID=1881030 RepID=UPI0008ACFDE4|nr:hypothetical protein [Devosia sp. YR412]SEP61749.1 hypothetical protein SAMN05428969_0149 [Devosia sp. YR412]